MSESAPAVPELSPTLWRTCRVLANTSRLRILAHLFQHPEQTVTALSEELDLTVGTASQYLRLLNSRGLLQARRTGRFVVYRVAPNNSIPGASDLVRALKAGLSRGSDPVANVFRLVTAFTHPRRIRIVKALGDQPMSFLELKRRTHIPPDALQRHLDKLAQRDIVATGRRIDSRSFRLQPPRGQLRRVLIRLAREA